MSDPSDLDALASRYLDLWQEQAAAMAANPALADLVARLFGVLGAGAASAFATAATEQHEPSRSDPQQRPGEVGGAAGASGAAPAGAASVAHDERLDELLRRVARIEERLAALEARGPKRRS